MNCEYAQKNYGVPACIGRNVTYRGRSGVISEDRGHYIGVVFDDDKPGHVLNFHPKTDGLEYHGMGKVRKMTKSQQRYQRYREYGDGFDSFLSFCYWDSDPARGWSTGR